MGRPMATSQDFVNWICSDQLDPRFLLYLLLGEEQSLLRFATGAIHQTIYYPELKAFHICLPALPEQQRIVAILDEAFAGLATATTNVKKNLKNARDLVDSYLAFIFTNMGKDWKTSELGKLVRFIDYRGKTPPKREKGIRLITAKNVKMNRIQRGPEEFIDASVYDGWMTRGKPRKGDVLFTTEAPLGNVAQLDTVEKVVIGQRLITMQPDEHILDRTFLKYALMSRPVQEEIFKRGTGATVVGIKASLLKRVPIAYPTNIFAQRVLAQAMEETSNSAAQLADNYRVKLMQLTSLKQSILCKALSGELANRAAAAAIPFPARSPTDPKRDTAVVLALAYVRHKFRRREKSYPHTKQQKILHLVEAEADYPLGRQPVRDAAGPNDFPHMLAAEAWAEANRYFKISKHETGNYQFDPLERFNDLLAQAKDIESDVRKRIEEVIDLFVPMNWRKAEVFATTYAAWNNLLLEGKTPTDEEIVHAAREDWHFKKLDIPRAEFVDCLKEVRQSGFKPTGKGGYVPPPAQGQLLL